MAEKITPAIGRLYEIQYPNSVSEFLLVTDIDEHDDVCGILFNKTLNFRCFVLMGERQFLNYNPKLIASFCEFDHVKKFRLSVEIEE